MRNLVSANKLLRTRAAENTTSVESHRVESQRAPVVTQYAEIHPTTACFRNTLHAESCVRNRRQFLPGQEQKEVLRTGPNEQKWTEEVIPGLGNN